ncbi:unnamed protein product [Adineta steineri]|uniref:Uncharacterized protein n=1 Tax=Adineta steineri TaxID=433720 RepID=A0A819AWV2_9BILA|nr:unnamed protein product [Adineta steineri]CAF3791907.1 unnamed protein product [Adineta steineri]
MNVNSLCYSLFVDINDTLYCSTFSQHRVLKRSLHDSAIASNCVAAGTGIQGSASNQLGGPGGIFVDVNFDLYVADCLNDRVQLFQLGESNGITVAGSTSLNPTITLSFPTAIILDADKYLFIVDYQNNRIVGSGLNGFRCLVGCYGMGLQSNQLNTPFSFSFDGSGNIFVIDQSNHRIQKFLLMNDSFALSFNRPKFCPTATWSSNGITIANQSIVGEDPNAIFSEELTAIIVAGSTSLNPTITLFHPTGIILDVEKYLFIVDSFNHRIVGSGLNGFRCLVGCYGRGSQSNQLFYPSSFSFDHSGNMFVTDTTNHRIQKFRYLKRYCVNTFSVLQNIYSSSLTESNQMYYRDCQKENFYYESIQVKVIESGYYSFRGSGDIDPYGSIYKAKFNPLDSSENLFDQDYDRCSDLQFKLNIYLEVGMTYVLIVTTYESNETGNFSIGVMGKNQVILQRLSKYSSKYSSKLTDDSPTYYRDCQVPQCHYETLQIHVNTTSLYVLWSESNINAHGYIYQNDFNPLKPSENLLLSHGGECNDGEFKLIIDLEINTRYILVVTTQNPKKIGDFSVVISGPNNISLSSFSPKESSCVIGDQCNFYIKGIGLTLDDILRNELKPNTVLNNQSFSIKLSAALTIIMFVAGLINSILSFITFQNKDSQQVGCGMYLLVSSITSLLAISMFIIKFWFVVLTHINVSTSLSVLRGGCASIEPILKLFLYLDRWLNACVAVERAVLILKGVKFDKKKSKSIARQTILILPFCICGTLIHELVFRRLFEYETALDTTYASKTNEDTIKRYVSCITRYSPSVQHYNTVVLFFHLVGPFIVNLFSALFIIFGGAQQRSMARTNKSPKEYIQEQFSEHKQLIISPIVLLVLSIPRLIISLLPGCVKTSENLWLYLGPYFISFTPSMLIFLIFVFPSELYMKAFKQSIIRNQRRTRP